LEEIEDKNGFITLDEQNTNYWNFDYETTSLLSNKLTSKVVMRKVKFSYDKEDQLLRVSLKYDGFWKKEGDCCLRFFPVKDVAVLGCH
jgi:hypothetical protein